MRDWHGNPTFENFTDAYLTTLQKISMFGARKESRIGSCRVLRNFVYSVDAGGAPEARLHTRRKPDYEYANAFADFVLGGDETFDPRLEELSPPASKFRGESLTQEKLETYGLPSNFSAFYGPRLRRQIDQVAEEIISSDHTRRAWISVLSVEDALLLGPLRSQDLPDVEYPCTIGFHFDVSDKTYLNVTATMRSQNMVSVFPYDYFVAWRLLNHMSELTGKIPGYVSGVILDAHIFERDLAHVGEVVQAHLRSGE